MDASSKVFATTRCLFVLQHDGKVLDVLRDFHGPVKVSAVGPDSFGDRNSDVGHPDSTTPLRRYTLFFDGGLLRAALDDGHYVLEMEENPRAGGRRVYLKGYRAGYLGQKWRLGEDGEVANELTGEVLTVDLSNDVILAMQR